jgi:hypothetical protein
VGCLVRLSSNGELEFTGPNACLGHWAEGIVLARTDRWVETWDMARKEGDRYFFSAEEMTRCDWKMAGLFRRLLPSGRCGDFARIFRK